MDVSAVTPPGLARLEPYLLRLHAATDTRSLWRALQQLIGRTFAHHSLVLGMRIIGDSPRPSVLLHSRPLPLRTTDWYEQNAAVHPCVPWLAQHPGTTLFRTKDVQPIEEWRRSAYFRQFVEPEGWFYGMAFLFWRGPLLDSMLCVNRTEAQGEMPDAEFDLAKRLHPHIDVAIRRVAALQDERDTRAAMASYLTDLPLPAVRLDWGLRLAFFNRAAVDTIERWEALRTRSPRARAKQRQPRIPPGIMATCREMKAEIRTAFRMAAPLPMPAARVVAHPVQEGFRAIVRPLVFNDSPLSEPSFWIHWEEQRDQRPLQHNLALFQRLTPRERELVLLVARGLSNREIVTETGRSLSTIKSQLAAAFRKLDVRRRAQLVARLQGS